MAYRHIHTVSRMILVIVTLSLGGTHVGLAAASDRWAPQVSERLIRLPSNHMVKAIEQDFQSSGLAMKLNDLVQDIALKHRTLAELQDAIGQAEGDIAIELKHQFLNEKKSLIELLSQQRDLQSNAVNTRVRLYEKLIRKMDNKSAALSASDRVLETQREEAKKRFEASMDKVDLEVLGRSALPESKYNKEYQIKQNALNKLLAAYENHALNKDPVADGGQSLDKRSYLQILVSDAQKESALLDQQGEIITYMARLVALDALALSEELRETEEETGISQDPERIDDTVDFFLTQY